MSALTTFVNCPNLQGQLEDIFCTGRVEDTPILSFLFSSFNNNGVLESRAVPSYGKKRVVELLYSPRVLESEVETTVDHDCTANSKRGETSQLYDFDEGTGVHIDKYFDILDLIERCESNDMYMARLIQEMIDGCKRRMETQAAVDLWANAGSFSSKDYDQDGSTITSSTKIVSTKYSAALGGYINNRAHSAIMQTARLNAYCTAPIIIGDYEIVDFYNDAKIGCCAQTGIDWSGVNAQAPIIIPSYRISDTAGSVNNFLTLSAGAAIPIWFNLYGGAKANMINDDSNYAGIIVDPATGIPFDLRITKGQVGTCTQVHIVIELAWDLFYAPSGLFAVGDHLRGVNFVNKHIVTNPA